MNRANSSQIDRSTKATPSRRLQGEIGVSPSRLDPESTRPLYLQLYDLLRSDILESRLAPGHRLAASRSLAADLGVSRNTVVSALDQLVAEGYLETRVGAGTFVSSEIPEELLEAPPSPARAPSDPAAGGRISSRARELEGLPGPPATPAPLRPFQVGAPAFDRVPWSQWSRAVNRAVRTLSVDLPDYGDPRGDDRLRIAVASHLRSLRGLDADPDQIFIVGGSQQALALSAQVLTDVGDPVWMEEPGYTGAKAALRGAGARLIPVRVGEDGLELAEGMRRAPQARLAYATPSHQYPMGVTMSLRRRLELLDWARQKGGWIVEDDYDSEYRFAGRPLAPLAALDPDRRVVYVGTFSKVLFPGLRLGYLVVPSALVAAFRAARFAADRQSSHLEQAALAHFMEDGSLARHIRRMRALYHRRWLTLAKEVGRRLGGRLQLTGGGAGLHVVGRLPRGTDDQAVAAAAADRGLAVTALSTYYLGRKREPGLVLGFAAFGDRQIQRGVRLLADILGEG